MLYIQKGSLLQFSFMEIIFIYHNTCKKINLHLPAMKKCYDEKKKKIKSTKNNLFSNVTGL